MKKDFLRKMKISLFSKKNIKQLLPKRKRTDNKTTGGKTLLIAGSTGMEGAAVLAARAAARCGAGYVYLLSDSRNLFTKNPDFLILQNLKNFEPRLFSSIAIGPGFKNKSILLKTLKFLILKKIENVVLDAEALSLLAEKKLKLPPSWILTPHEGELARMLKVSSEEIRLNRKKYALQAQKVFGCIVVLKGSGTLVADSDRIVQISSGNPSLGKAGTGDVLTGMIAGFLSQKVPAFEAACLAAFIHGFIADQWLQKGSDVLSLMASDLIEQLPQTLKYFRK